MRPATRRGGSAGTRADATEPRTTRPAATGTNESSWSSVNEKTATEVLIAAFQAALGERVDIDGTQAQRWDPGLVQQPVGTPFLEQDGLFVCGDGLLGRDVDAAFLSGFAAADALNAS